MNGLSDQSDYNSIKKSHIDYITEQTGTEVLYYKLYKKDKDSYLGCGDLTIDTKDGMDKLLQEESLKEYSFTVDLLDAEIQRKICNVTELHFYKSNILKLRQIFCLNKNL